MTVSRTCRTIAAALAVSCTACGAFFPQYTTVVRPVPAALAASGSLTPPGDTLFRLAAVRATVPLRTADNRPWDDDGTEADPYVMLSRNGSEVFRTSVRADTREPEWEPAREHVDLRVRPTDRIRIELREDDGIVTDPIGVYDYTGIPDEARTGGGWLAHLSNGATVEMQCAPPPPQLGLGVTFRYQREALGVVSVVETGPAYGTGLRPGDRIVAVDGRAISAMTESEAREALDRGADHTVVLRVERDSAPATDLTIEPDALYLVR